MIKSDGWTSRAIWDCLLLKLSLRHLSDLMVQLTEPFKAASSSDSVWEVLKFDGWINRAMWGCFLLNFSVLQISLRNDVRRSLNQPRASWECFLPKLSICEITNLDSWSNRAIGSCVFLTLSLRNKIRWLHPTSQPKLLSSQTLFEE